MRRLGALVAATAGLALALLLAPARPAGATLDLQKKAKAAGFEATNCLYCHKDKLPKKGAAPGNERGEWLKAEKAKRGVKEVDPAWLKDYVEPK